MKNTKRGEVKRQWKIQGKAIFFWEEQPSWDGGKVMKEKVIPENSVKGTGTKMFKGKQTEKWRRRGKKT